MALSRPLVTALGLGLLSTLGAAQAEVKKDYAEVNGLKMYYEVHGTGKPLVLLHGAFGTVEMFAPVLPTLGKERQVILVEIQAHGRTADIDRPISYRQSADDVAALLNHLEVKNADVFGYSMGGTIATGIAIRHPELVDRIVMLGANLYSLDKAYDPEMAAVIKSTTPETFDFPQVKDPYTQVAPDPSQWPVLVKKLIESFRTFDGYTPEELKSVKAKTLLMVGDREGLVFESVLEWYRTIPNAQLAVFPNADHFYLFTQTEDVTDTIIRFFNEPLTTTEEGQKQ